MRIIKPGGSIKFMANSKGESYYIARTQKEVDAIESTTMFKIGSITLEEVDDSVSSEELVVRSDSSAKSEELEIGTYADASGYKSEVESYHTFEDVTKCVDAIAILRKLGVQGALSNKAKIVEAAKSVNVEFPNL